MNILYTFDNKFVPIAAISIISLLENNKLVDCINIYIFGENINNENIRILDSIIKYYNRNFIYNDISNISIPSNTISKRWPKSGFIRLYLGSILPNTIEKILYLDSDTIINSCLSELYSTDITNSYLAASKDCIGDRYKKNIKINYYSTYFNSGVLLINVNMFRNININDLISMFSYNKNIAFKYPDQDFLNYLCNGKIIELDIKYNVMTIYTELSYTQLKFLRNVNNFYTEQSYYYALSNPSVIHYTSFFMSIRPWYINSNHKLAVYYERYKDIFTNFGYFISNSRLKRTQYFSKYILMHFPKILLFPPIRIIHSYIIPILISIRHRIKYAIRILR